MNGHDPHNGIECGGFEYTFILSELKGLNRLLFYKIINWYNS